MDNRVLNSEFFEHHLDLGVVPQRAAVRPLERNFSVKFSRAASQHCEVVDQQFKGLEVVLELIEPDASVAIYSPPWAPSRTWQRTMNVATRICFEEIDRVLQTLWGREVVGFGDPMDRGPFGCVLLGAKS